MTRPLLLGLSLVVSLSACPSLPEPPGDAGPDAGAPDAGRPDAGTPDAGPPDAGPPDAGTLPSDGGFDAWPPGCQAAPHDAVLGTAQLGAAFQVLDWAPLPASYHLPLGATPEAAAPGGVGLAVYGLMGDGRVHRLGRWPQLELPAEANLAFDGVAAADRARQVLTAWTLPATQGALLAGYRTVQGMGFVGGGVTRFDTTRPDAGVVWLQAHGVESALGLGAYFLVGAERVGDPGDVPGVYVLPAAGPPGTPALAATYPTLPGETVHPGPMAVTTQGLVVLGYALDLAGERSLRLPPPAALAEALSGGPPLALQTLPVLASGTDLAHLAGFGTGVALLHATEYQGILPTLGHLDHLTLTPADGGVVVGAPRPILSAGDACTVVSQLVPAGEQLLVGLWDRNGQRILRLAPR